ncbi:hypothetical protein VTN77DRAFT_6429 [Rasamsonia byssochlamydoides]|uniref:uncharacterized protein n=1 Tax=Rasamsonia byssochlamydoides TaxID=89139 RepID=UPI003742F2D8
MSSTLLKHFLQDDVDSFKRFLATAGHASAGQKTAGGNITPKVGSPLASSPRSKKTTGTSPGTSFADRSGFSRPNTAPLSRAQVNARDQYGRTLLHLIASSPKPTAIEFATALLEVPFVDIYAQDLESGWTALHRALYAGNASIAHALMARDMRDATDFSTPNAAHHPSGGLIKIKDREGNSPFDVYGATILARDIKRTVSLYGEQNPTTADPGDSDASSISHSAYGEDYGEDTGARATLRPRVNLQADEVFTFGSNKNLTLGLGDEDDRQFPERIFVERPEHLLQRFYRERKEARASRGEHDSFASQDTSRPTDLPTVIRNKPVVFQDVVMSKLHTAVLTNDPESNLFMCGFGPGGRLGTGDEVTRFSFVCIETGALAGKKIVSVALGQDHSIAISEQGEVFTWGSNKYGQLGYNLPRTGNKNDTPIQTTPRQIFNPFKREVILGAAASSIHSVVFTNSGLYTFGKNEGQLGLVDSDARSLDVQVTPRRVGVSLFNSPIQMVSAIDRATTVLLESHDVWVFTHYGYSKVVFPLDYSSSFIKNSFLATRYGSAANHITKVTSGRNTICALSSFGEVYTVQVNNKPDTGSVAASTTNPAKIRNSLSPPERVWSVRKAHMAVRDVGVGQDGSIIICTTSGSAWRKEKCAKIKEAGSKDYKFVRIPGVSRVVGVRSNAYGAYAIAQRECDVAKEQIHVGQSTLWHDLFQLLPFKDLTAQTGDTIEEPSDLHSTPSLVAKIKAAVLSSPDIESQIKPILEAHELYGENAQGGIWIKSTTSDIRIPVHEFVLAGRSTVLRKALGQFRQNYYFSIPDVLAIEYDRNGQIQISFEGVDFLSILNLVFFLYTDNVLDVWREIRHSSANAFRYRQVRTEVMRIATHLELRTLERAARVMVEPTRSLNVDLERAIKDPAFFESSDVTIQLKGGSAKAHSQLLCQRCPFFEGLFHGRSGGRWLASRRGDPAQDTISVDLKDIEPKIFSFVLRHIYGDTEVELFDDVRSANLDDFIDLILDVMSVANELMIDRLAQICQKMLGQFVNTRNVCHLLNAVAPCTVTEFKEAALEYICLNLEVMLENRLLNDLDEELLCELDAICQENQLARYPVSRGRNSEDFILEKYPELVGLIENDRQRRIDSMRLQSRLDQNELHDERIRAGGLDKSTSSPSARKTKPLQSSEGKTVVNSPVLKSRQSTGDLMFQMDEEGTLSPAPPRKTKPEEIGDSWQASGPSLGSSQPKLSQGDSLDERSYLDDKMGSMDSAGGGTSAEGLIPTPQKLQPGSPSPGNSASKSPWGSPVISGGKRDLKDIMAEASQSRVSNLTLGMSGRQNNSTGGTFTQRLSQRERKKLQQQQLQEKLAAEQKAKEFRQSPWQTPAKQAVSAPREPSAEPGWGKTASDQVKATQKPAMTLRQTLAGVPPGRPMPGSSPSQSNPLSTPPRPVKPAQPSPTPSTPAQPIIQSIRHTPRPERPAPSFTGSSSGPLSLATILLQQQAEKDELREAVTAKHSLQDIQLEQEFQEWWDKESKRVMEAEAAAAAAKERKGEQRSRGKNRGQRKDRSKDGSTSEAPSGAIQPSAAATPEKRNTSHRSNHPKAPPIGGQANEGGSNSHRGHRRPRTTKGKEPAHNT